MSPSPSPSPSPPRRARKRPGLGELPDDVLLRVLSLTGGPGDQVGTAYRLAAVSARFRRLLIHHFLASITHLSHDCLRSLSLACPAAARAALLPMFAAATAVKDVSLGGLSRGLLNRACVLALADAARDSLVSVNFAYCRVTDDVVSPLLRCPNLRFLTLHSCIGVTGEMFADPDRVAPVEFLDVSWVHALTRDGVRAIASIGSLKNLVMTGCDAVNTRTLRAFASAQIRHNLREICLSYCPLNDAALMEFVKCTPTLQRLVLAESTLNLWSTGNFTPRGIEEIHAAYPDVEIVFKT